MRQSAKREAIRTRLAQGQKPAKIAEDLGVARSTVYRISKKEPSRKGDRAAYCTVSARVTDAELASMESVRKRVGGLSRSDLLRRMVRMCADMPAPTPDEELAFAAAEVHLQRLGGNFNQIAAALSASVKKIGRADPTREQIEAMRRADNEIRELKGLLTQIMENAQVRNAQILSALSMDKPS